MIEIERSRSKSQSFNSEAPREAAHDGSPVLSCIYCDYPMAESTESCSECGRTSTSMTMTLSRESRIPWERNIDRHQLSRFLATMSFGAFYYTRYLRVVCGRRAIHIHHALPLALWIIVTGSLLAPLAAAFLSTLLTLGRYGLSAHWITAGPRIISMNLRHSWPIWLAQSLAFIAWLLVLTLIVYVCQKTRRQSFRYITALIAIGPITLAVEGFEQFSVALLGSVATEFSRSTFVWIVVLIGATLTLLYMYLSFRILLQFAVVFSVIGALSTCLAQLYLVPYFLVWLYGIFWKAAIAN